MKSREMVLGVFAVVGAVFLMNRPHAKVPAVETPETAVPTATGGRSQPVAGPVAPSSVAPSASPTLPATESKTVAEFQQEIAKCFDSNSGFAKATTPEQLVNEILKSNPVKSTELEVENIHLRMNDGSERRLHLIPSDKSQNKNARELRLFSLDGDGLPVLMPLSKQQRFHPTAAVLADLQKGATPIFHQVKESKLLRDDSHLSLNTVDGKIFEFELFGATQSFSCRKLDCLCH